MAVATPDFATVAKAQFEAFAQLTEVTLHSAERAIDINVKAARSAFADGAATLKALAAAKEPAELQSLAAKFAQPKLDGVNTYARELYETASTAQAEVAKLVEAQVAEFQKNAAATFDALKKNAPAGTESFATFARSAWDNASQAYETVAKSAREAFSTLESTLTPAPVVTSKKRG